MLGPAEAVDEGVRLDFAFADGWHAFDHALVALRKDRPDERAWDVYVDF